MEKTRIDGGSPLLLLGALFALSYLGAQLIETPVAAEAAWKASGILFFAGYALSRGAKLIGAALLASAAGDVALALRPPVFEAGMAFFGLAHLLYIAAFFFRIRTEGADRRFAVLSAAVVLISAGLLLWFYPDMGDLRAPGIAYQTIITLMVAIALVSSAPLIGRAGAALFMVSDMLIALGLYKHIAVPPGSVWITYAAAQGMIAWALSGKRADD